VKLGRGFSDTETPSIKPIMKGKSVLCYFPSGQNCKENLEQ